MKTDPVTELELETSATALRVTNEQVEANIRDQFYFTAYEGVLGEQFHHNEKSPEAKDGTEAGGASRSVPDELRLLTICVLVLDNGFTVLGQSTCASPDNFNQEIGRRLAREDAKNKIWAFMGYELRSHLAYAQTKEFLGDGEKLVAEALEDAAERAQPFAVEQL